ncbi:MAG: DUF6125 family protein [Syntrophales bacterium]
MDSNLKIDLMDLPKETLVDIIKMYSKNVLAVDGLWFLECEKRYGIEKAIEIDTEVWGAYGSIEAARIKETLKIEGHGIPALVKALNFQIWLPCMEFEFAEITDKSLIFNVTKCRPQQTRIRKEMGEFACKPVGVALFEVFARGINPNMTCKCLVCPPDKHSGNLWCSWLFEIHD